MWKYYLIKKKTTTTNWKLFAKHLNCSNENRKTAYKLMRLQTNGYELWGLRQDNNRNKHDLKVKITA